MSGVFVNVNRGKRSVVLDLRTDAGKAALRALIARATSSSTRCGPRRSPSWASATRRSPPSIRRSSTPTATATAGAAPSGPPAYDDTIQAECGLPAVQQMLTGEANYVGTIIADKVAGLTALYATTMALFHRERTGEGQEVEVAMFETMASFMLVEHANGAMFDPPLGPALYHRAVAPNRKPYRTKDGYISALIYNDKHWAAFVDAVQPAWASDRLRDARARARQIDTVYALLGETFNERTTQEWLDLLRDARDPGGAAAHPRRAVRQRTSQRRRLLRDGGHAHRAGALSRRADLVLAHARACRRVRPGARRRHP